jgi:hypothetical protein
LFIESDREPEKQGKPMWKKFLTLGLVITVLTAAGCQKEHAVSDPNMQVTLIGTSQFPPQLVGLWWNEEHGWAFRFDRTGRIPEIVHTFGRFIVRSGQPITHPMVDNGTAVIVPGKWFVEYDAKSRQITIEINLDSYDLNIGQNNISGSSRDVFSGTIPEPGQIKWSLNWLMFPENYVTTADGQFVNHHLPVTDDERDQGMIEFVKLRPKDEADLPTALSDPSAQ